MSRMSKRKNFHVFALWITINDIFLLSTPSAMVDFLSVNARTFQIPPSELNGILSRWFSKTILVKLMSGNFQDEREKTTNNFSHQKTWKLKATRGDDDYCRIEMDVGGASRKEKRKTTSSRKALSMKFYCIFPHNFTINCRKIRIETGTEKRFGKSRRLRWLGKSISSVSYLTIWFLHPIRRMTLVQSRSLLVPPTSRSPPSLGYVL